MSHDELGDLAAGYALSALDPDELQMFEAHLATCPECQAEVAGMRPLVDAFYMLNERVEPTDDLRERILASARAESVNPEPAAQTRRELQIPWWRRPTLRPLPVAAVFIALAIAIALVSVWGSQADSDFSSAQRRLDLTYDGLEIMAQADQWWRFDGSEIHSGVTGTLAYSEEFGAACLLIWGLSENDQFTYQARMTQATGQVTERNLWRYNNAMWLILEGDPNLLQKLEVILPAEGSATDPAGSSLIDIPLTSS